MNTNNTMSSELDGILKPINYLGQTKYWPDTGRVILARFDEDCVVVYQAFKPSIADYAVQHQRYDR